MLLLSSLVPYVVPNISTKLYIVPFMVALDIPFPPFPATLHLVALLPICPAPPPPPPAPAIFRYGPLVAK